MSNHAADHAAILDDYTCPITLKLTEEATMLVKSGHTYEQRALEETLVRQPRVDSRTNARFAGRGDAGPHITCSAGCIK